MAARRSRLVGKDVVSVTLMRSGKGRRECDADEQLQKERRVGRRSKSGTIIVGVFSIGEGGKSLLLFKERVRAWRDLPDWRDLPAVLDDRAGVERNILGGKSPRGIGRERGEVLHGGTWARSWGSCLHLGLRITFPVLSIARDPEAIEIREIDYDVINHVQNMMFGTCSWRRVPVNGL